jgi:acetylornithine deacetylase/succinyl-diaminopimelate desuccinylase-like protein
VIRQLLSRLEDQQTGVVVPPEFTIEIPEHRVVEARIAAKALGSAIYDHIPFVGGMSPVSSDPAELILNRTWRAQLAVIGADGLPALNAAGNVLRPSTAVKLSLRLPPTLSAELATRNLKTILESDPPYGARVQFEPGPFGDGWNAPKVAPWLSASLDRASIATFKRPAAAAGEGGSIPFIGMLGAMFPHAQFVITGVLGPESNAHGPNEFLHVATAKHVTSAVARILADHHRRPGP